MAITGIVCGSVYNWQRTLTKDGAAWTTATAASLWFISSRASVATELPLALVSGSTWGNVNPATLFDHPGQWRCWVEGTEGGQVDYSVPETFNVSASPVALN